MHDVISLGIAIFEFRKKESFADLCPIELSSEKLDEIIEKSILFFEKSRFVLFYGVLICLTFLTIFEGVPELQFSNFGKAKVVLDLCKFVPFNFVHYL